MLSVMIVLSSQQFGRRGKHENVRALSRLKGHKIMKVLIAIDESGFSEEFCNFIFSHKWKAATEFVILSIVSNIMPGVYMTILPAALLEDIDKEACSAAEKLVRDLGLKLRDHYHSPRVKELVLKGDPGPSIVDCAAQETADLIVLGTHKRRGLDRFLMGSVSSYVSAHAPCSVMLVSPQTTNKLSADAQALAGSST